MSDANAAEAPPAGDAPIEQTFMKRALRKPSRRAALWLAVLWLVVAGLAIPQFLRAARVEDAMWSYVVAMVPWAMLAAVVLAVAMVATAAFVRTVHVAAPAAVLTLLAGIGIAQVAPLYVAAPSSGETEVVVATINMSYGRADADQVTALVEDHSVDILAIEELTFDGLLALGAAGLEELMPYGAVFPSNGAGGTAVYSRYAISGGSVIPSAYTFGNVRATVHAPGGDITVFAVHPAPPLPTHTDWWERDMRMLRQEIAAVDGPVIVAGDFNSTYDHALFRDILADGFEDAADQAGAGLLLTYPDGASSSPLVAIDHVLERDTGLVAHEAYTISLDQSDHRALVVKYAAAPAG